MSTTKPPAQISLSGNQQAVLIAVGLFFFNLALVSVPTGAPKYVTGLFTAIAGASILIKGMLPSQLPSKLSTQSLTILGIVVAVMTSANAYISFSFPSSWYWGLLIGLIGTAILTINELTEGQPLP